jgi:putative toxin-antitoxin system antitoxin component (TIGR02293 family)
MRYKPDIYHRSYSGKITSANVLGGTKVLGEKIRTPMDWHNLILKGIPAGVIDRLNEKWGLTDIFIARIVGASARTISRKRQIAGERLSTVQSDRLYRIARIIALAVDVFEDKETALEWLNKRQPGLGSRTPFDMLQTAPETAEVESLLYRLRNPSKHFTEIVEP